MLLTRLVVELLLTRLVVELLLTRLVVELLQLLLTRLVVELWQLLLNKDDWWMCSTLLYICDRSTDRVHFLQIIFA